MIKKMFISLLFFAMHNIYIISMDLIESSDKIIDYNHFFDLCQNGKKDAIANFVNINPNININYQDPNHGTTPLLHAATWDQWNTVWYLLENCNANKMMKDNYGQTLFSKAVYSLFYVFKKSLTIYSFDEINALCKTMCLDRDKYNPTKFAFDIAFNKTFNTKILDALDNKKDLNEKNKDGLTILHKACDLGQIPFIIKLLECGANLDIKDNDGDSSYDCLYKEPALFVIREAFNNGPCIPTALMNAFFINIAEMNCDVANYIKELYIELILKDLFESPKARIWKYACKKACKKMGFVKKNEKADEKRCLATIMLLPQHKLTEINIQLALENK